MSSWQEVAQRDDPVVGPPEEFQRSKDAWNKVASMADTLRDNFASINNTDACVGMKGHTAQALASFFTDAQQSLNDLPQVCRDIASVMANHEAKLRGYRTEAASALARATAAWNDKNTASAVHSGSSQRLTALQKQIQQLQALPPDQGAGQIATVQGQLSTERASLSAAARKSSDADGRLTTELKKWDGLHADEDRLNKQTAGSLHHVNLRSLRDPGLLERMVHSAEHFVGDIGSDIFHLVHGLLTGNMSEELWALHDLLDKVEKVLSVLTVIVLVVGFIIAVVATDGAALAFAPAVLEGLTFASLAFSAAKLEVDSGIVLGNYSDPKTGRRLTILDLGFDALDVGLNELAALNVVPLDTSLTGLDHYNALRSLTIDQIGVSYSAGYDVAWDLTAQRFTYVLTKEGMKDVALPWGNDQLNNLSSSTDPTYPMSCVSADLQRMHASDRGFASGVDVCLLPAY